MKHEARKPSRVQLIRSLKGDCERWWVQKFNEVEKAAVTGDSDKSYLLIRNTSP